MERNDDFSSQSAGQGGIGGTGSAGTGNTGAGSAGNAGAGFGAGGSSGVADRASDAAHSVGDKARSGLQQGKEAVADTFGTLKEKASNLNLKEKAGNLNMTLADKLEAGADKLRQRGQGGELAGAAGYGDVGSASGASSDQMAQVGTKLAAGMESTADWLRNGDLQQTVEQQVRTNPGRTLLIALGLGYVLGKAFRR